MQAVSSVRISFMKKLVLQIFCLFLSIPAFDSVADVSSKSSSGDNVEFPGLPPEPPPPTPLPKTTKEWAKYNARKWCDSNVSATMGQVNAFWQKYDVSRTKSLSRDIKLTSILRPVYPQKLLRKSITGEVQVLVAVSNNGMYTDSLVLCSPNEDFASAALNEISKAKYLPAMLDDTAVNSCAIINVNFEL